MKKLAFTLDLRVYPFDLRFSFGESDEELLKWLKKTKVKKEDHEICKYENDSCRARCVMFENGASLIRMRSIPDDSDEYATLQHEITHYVMFLLFNKLNTPHNMETTEMYAYLTAYITKEVYNKIW